MHAQRVTAGFSYAIGVVDVGGAQHVFSIGVWLMAAVVVGIGGIFVARRVRRWLQRKEEVSNFSLENLREMRRCGRISDQEFDLLKRQAIREAVVPASHESVESDGAGQSETTDDAPENPESE